MHTNTQNQPQLAVEDINTLIEMHWCESLPDVRGFNADRIRFKTSVARKPRAKQLGNKLTPDGTNPKNSITPRTANDGDHVSPKSTLKGRMSLKEAVEFIRNYRNTTLPVAAERLKQGVPEGLTAIVGKLLCIESEMDKAWLWDIYRIATLLECRDARKSERATS